MPVGSMLDDLLRTRTHVRVARALFRLPQGFATSGREIARRAGVDNKLAQAALEEMAEAGLVETNRTSSANFFRLNPKHVLYPSLKALFATESQVPADIMQALLNYIRGQRLPVRSAYIFGSVARGDDKLSSDLDVALIAAQGHQAEVEEALEPIGEVLKQQFGRNVHFLVGAKDLGRLQAAERSKSGIWHRVASEGKEVGHLGEPG